MPNLKSLLPDFLQKAIWPSPEHKAAKEFGLFMRSRDRFSESLEKAREAYMSTLRRSVSTPNPMSGGAVIFPTQESEKSKNLLHDFKHSVGKIVETDKTGEICSPNIFIPMESKVGKGESTDLNLPEDVKDEIIKLVQKYRVHYALQMQLGLGRDDTLVDKLPTTINIGKEKYDDSAHSKIFFSTREELLKNLGKAD